MYARNIKVYALNGIVDGSWQHANKSLCLVMHCVAKLE